MTGVLVCIYWCRLHTASAPKRRGRRGLRPSHGRRGLRPCHGMRRRHGGRVRQIGEMTGRRHTVFEQRSVRTRQQRGAVASLPVHVPPPCCSHRVPPAPLKTSAALSFVDAWQRPIRVKDPKLPALPAAVSRTNVQLPADCIPVEYSRAGVPSPRTPAQASRLARQQADQAINR